MSGRGITKAKRSRVAKTPASKAIEEIGATLADFFVDEPWKITVWLVTDNLNFGGCEPARYIMINPKKALRLIREMREGNIA